MDFHKNIKKERKRKYIKYIMNIKMKKKNIGTYYNITKLI